MKTKRAEEGFTRIDLLAVMAVCGLLALTVAGSAHSDGEAAVCQNNMRQLMRAHFLYAADQGYFPPNGSDSSEGGAAGRVWVGGIVGVFEPGATNVNNTVNSMLSPYLEGGPRVFRCPSDSVVDIRSKAQRVRTVSMNHAVGTDPQDGDGPCKRAVPGSFLDANFGHTANAKYRCFARPSDIVNPTPANLFVMLDEHPEGINDAMFASMGPQASAGLLRWVDVPASFHYGSGSFGFADGRAQLHQWVAPFWATINPFPVATNPSQLPDLQWLAERTSALRSSQP